MPQPLTQSPALRFVQAPRYCSGILEVFSSRSEFPFACLLASGPPSSLLPGRAGTPRPAAGRRRPAGGQQRALQRPRDAAPTAALRGRRGTQPSRRGDVFRRRRRRVCADVTCRRRRRRRRHRRDPSARRVPTKSKTLGRRRRRRRRRRQRTARPWGARKRRPAPRAYAESVETGAPRLARHTPLPTLGGGWVGGVVRKTGEDV